MVKEGRVRRRTGGGKGGDEVKEMEECRGKRDYDEKGKRRDEGTRSHTAEGGKVTGSVAQVRGGHQP